MRIPDPKANTTTEAYLAYKAGYLEESELKPVLYEPYLHFDGWLAYWAGLVPTYPVKEIGKNLLSTKMATSTPRKGNPQRDRFVITCEDDRIDWVCNVAEFPLGNGGGIVFEGLKVKKGKTYTLSFTLDSARPMGNVRLANNYNFDSGFQSLYNGDQTTAVGPDLKYTFTANNDWSQLRLYIWSSVAASVSNTGAVINPQLELGSDKTTYETFSGKPEMLCDEEALVAYLSGVTDTYPEEIKDPYDVRIVGYLKHLASIRWPEPDYPVNNEEFYLSTMEPTHTSNPEPSADIELDTTEGKIISVEAYGDTYQQTYDGKNLFNKSMAPTVIGGGTNTVTETATGVRITVTTAGTYSFRGWILGKVSDYLNNTLTLSANVSKSANGVSPNMYIGYCNDVGGSRKSVAAVAGVGKNSCSTQITEVDADGREYIIVALYGTEGRGASIGDYSEYDDVQIQIGEETAYEPYVGGIPAPNPDYPQTVQVVAGEQTVTVTGKNKVNGAYSEISQTARCTAEASGNGFKITSASSSGAIYVTVPIPNIASLLGQTVTVSYIATGDGIRARFFYLDASGNATGNIGSSETVTLPDSLDGNAGIGIVFYTSNNGSATYNDIQLEIGSTTTDYQPYQSQSYPISLGSTELCKIGDYQDYIYKSGDDWYVHKECGKVILDGSNDEGWQTSSYSRVRSSSIYGLQNNPPDVFNYYSNQLINANSETTENSFSVGTSSIFVHATAKSTTISDWETWLSSNNLIIYGMLATPTDTKITDATLVGQLDALAGADTYNEKTYIKVTANDPNLPALLKVEAYKY